MWDSIIRQVLLPAQEAVLGRPTLRVRAELEDRSTESAEEIERYQLNRLRELVAHACREIPYWRARLGNHERIVGAPSLRAALDHLPILTRSDIQRDLDSMFWRDARGKLLLHRSSGTTDDNLRFYFDRQRQAWDRALRMRSLDRFGIRSGTRQLQFWPLPAYHDPVNRLKDPLRHLRDWVRRGVVLDLRPMSPEQLDRGLELLQALQPELVIAYPSWLTALSRRAQAMHREIRLHRLRLVLCLGEILYDFQRAEVESAFGAKVVEEFGAHDSGTIAGEDCDGRWLLNWEHLCIEILRDSRPPPAGELGELVITNLHSHAMPFIRYATGDVAVAPAETARDGVLNVRMPRIEGRTSDLLLATDGRPVSNRETVEMLVRNFGSMEFSLFQPEDDRVVCMTIRDGGWLGQEGAVEDALRSTLGADLRIEWKVGRAFRPLLSGKHRFVCSPAAHALLAHDKLAGISVARAWPQRLRYSR
jgi:phenylacetate-CoA ligase